MRKTVITAILLLLVGTILGGTVFRDPVAHAATTASAVLNVVVTNNSANPVPVREQNTDGNGNIKVHEQGTANVSLTNSSVVVTAPAVKDGGGAVAVGGGQAKNVSAPPPTGTGNCTGPCTASALVITMTAGVTDVGLILFSSGGSPAIFFGPGSGGEGTIVIALTRPITFDTVSCDGPVTSACLVSWVGNSP